MANKTGAADEPGRLRPTPARQAHAPKEAAPPVPASFSIVDPRWFDTPLQAGIYSYLYIAWLLSELGLYLVSRHAARTRPPAPSGRRGDRGSYLVIVAGVLLSIGVSYAARSAGPAAWLLPSWCFWLGAAMMLGGMTLRVWAVHTLGRFFNTVVTIRSDHRLVTTGPYRLLRHPAYSGSLATLIGVPLCLRTATGLIVLLLLIPAVFAYRMAVEERALLARFGSEYADFMRRRWRLIPFVY